jgi:DNA polymerase I-like protein with 3'-5' exonuclease and polymerase domains
MLIAAHEQNLDDGDPQIYNGFDCVRTHKILTKLLDLPQYGPIYNLERGMQGPVMEMMLRGFLIDPMERENAVQDIKARLEGISKVLDLLSFTLSDNPLNYNSHKQIKELFYDLLKIPPIEKSFKGEKKTPMNEETLEKLRLKHPSIRPLCAAILSCRDLKKQLEKLQMEVDDDWRIRTSINIAGTNEGRFSSSKSFTGTGGNMQNVTESVRRMFISDPGWRLFGIDKEQAESRWVGLYCGILFDDWSYLDALQSGDGHTAVARMVWEKDLPWTGNLKQDREIADRPFAKETYRQSCKILAHATNILGRPPTISIHTGIPVKLVKDFQDKYFSAFPCIPKYHTWLAQQLQTKQYLTNIFGRQRDFFDRPEADETIRQAAAFMQASSNADDINLGLWRVWKKMGLRVQLLTQEHDAIYGQFKSDDDERNFIDTVQEHLKVEIDLGTRKFSVPTDAKTGRNKGLRWKNGQEINPFGLDKPCAPRPNSYYT